MQKINARWRLGIFVGVRRRSNELVVLTEDGVMVARDIHRIPFEQQWGLDNLKWVKWVPWHRYRGAVDADGVVLDGVEHPEVDA